MRRTRTLRGRRFPARAFPVVIAGLVLAVAPVRGGEFSLSDACVSGMGLARVAACARFPSSFERVSPADGAGPDSAADSVRSSGSTAKPLPAPLPSARRRIFDRKTLGLTAGFMLEVPVFGWVSWWKDLEHRSFHATNEGWFGRDTYAGGADKVSHFYVGYLVSRELIRAYQDLGHPPAEARALAVGVTTAAGLVTESGDAVTEYGFSWEDATAGILGALSASEISRRGWDDLFGLRLGRVHAQIPGPDHRAHGTRSDYSRELYSADVKLAGALRRLGARPGPARWLLLSVTYGSKGYRFSPVERQQRNLGLDVGLNIPEILQALGVRERTWWGRPILAFFSYYRLIYTAVGVRYDFNHHRWHGPDSGDRFNPGAVFYP